MTLREIAHALRGNVCGREVLAPGPNHSPNDRSLSVRLSPGAPDGFLAFSHAGDDWKACRDHVRERLGWSRRRDLSNDQDAWRLEKSRSQKLLPPLQNRDRGTWREIWDASVDPRVPLVRTYLRNRALDLTDELAGDVLRWNPRIGALVALFRNVRTDERQAISRTFLDAGGQKIQRKFLGTVGGAAIKLDPDDAVTDGLHIGEGVETCMAARQFGLRPCWSLGSKGAIAAFPVLAGIEALTILAEPDAGREIEECARRWYDAEREVFINTSLVGKDLNDALVNGRGIA